MTAEQLRAHVSTLPVTPALAAEIDSRKHGPYRGYRELTDAWLGLTSAGARAREIGRSARDTPLFALEVGPRDAETSAVVMAGIHPIEWIGVEVLLGIMARLVAEPPRDRRIVAFPLVNVDGYRRVEADLRAGRRRWRRTNANGVDLNRNWPTHFSARSRATSVIAGYNNGGPHPLSEPEVAAVATALDELAVAAPIRRALSLHSIGRMVLVPYGGVWGRPTDHEDTVRVAKQVRDAMTRRYTIRQSARWVPGSFARGMELDHLRDAYGATALLVECSLGGARLTDPTSVLSPFRVFNPPAPHAEVAALAPALESFLRG